MKLSPQTLTNIHMVSLRHDIPRVDLLTWAYVLTGGSERYIRVASDSHIYDKIYGENDVVQYLNRLHIGLFGFRASFARHLGHKGSPIELLKPTEAVKYFAAYLAMEYSRHKNFDMTIAWVGEACILPANLNAVTFDSERAKVSVMSVL